MSDFDLQGLAQVSVSTDLPAHKRIVNDAITEIATLRQELTTAQAENEALRARVDAAKDEWFFRGVCATLAMFDPKSNEYHEAVVQHGGYESLYASAEEYDREHLYVAAKCNHGAGYAKKLHAQSYEAEQAGAARLRRQADEMERQQ